jgi:hypothetical protein
MGLCVFVDGSKTGAFLPRCEMKYILNIYRNIRKLYILALVFRHPAP